MYYKRRAYELGNTCLRALRTFALTNKCYRRLLARSSTIFDGKLVHGVPTSATQVSSSRYLGLNFVAEMLQAEAVYGLNLIYSTATLPGLESVVVRTRLVANLV